MTELMKRYVRSIGFQPSEIDFDKHRDAYIHWLEAQLRWRPVSEGLPEKQGGFFVRTPHSFPKNIPYQVAEFYDDNKTFYEEHTDSPLDDVTHWLPVPPAPEVKEIPIAGTVNVRITNKKKQMEWNETLTPEGE